MESVHCFECYCFPSKDVPFFITNCMHIFCGSCKNKADNEDPQTCLECKKSRIKYCKMGPDMPEQVKDMFQPVAADSQQIQRNLTRILTFQSKQRSSLMNGLTKKEEAFDKLRAAHNNERSKKEQYKKQLVKLHGLLKQQNSEIAELKSVSAEGSSVNGTVASETVHIFTESMYKTPKTKKNSFNKFSKEKSKTSAIEKRNISVPFTPCLPPKTSLGFVTPKNPSNKFPHLKKLAVPKQNSQ